ncbi:MAG: hypothetical protein JW850_16045 [Thermoflexales bacterium]|nr:hypothetical protein [Thermoflexales bacterium]
MHTCPYCLHRFPDDATACSRCDVELRGAWLESKLKSSDEGGERSVRAAARPLKSTTLLSGRRPLVLGGVAAGVVVLLLVAGLLVPRMFGGTPQPTRPPARPTSSGAGAPPTAIVGGFPTPLPPSGWREWLLARAAGALKLWLPDDYEGVEFASYNWRELYAKSLAQNTYLRAEANKVQPSGVGGTLLVATSPRSETAVVRVMLLDAPQLAGADAPKLDTLQKLVKGLDIEGEVLNQRSLKNSDRTCDTQAQMTQAEIIPSSKSSDAWRGFIVAVTQEDKAYVMTALVGQRDFPTTRDTLERALGSLCSLLPNYSPTPVPSPTSSPSPTPVPSFTPLPTYTPSPSPTPLPATPTTRPTASATPSSTPKPTATQAAPSPTPAASPQASPSPQPTPVVLTAWQAGVKGGRLELELPAGYGVVNFTESDWQQVYSPTIVANSFVRIQAVRVHVGLSKGLLLAAASHPSDTLPVYVVLVDTPLLAGADRPTVNKVWGVLVPLELRGRVMNPRNLDDCGLQRTKMEFSPSFTSGPKPLQGFVIAANGPDKGYVIAALSSPEDYPAASELLEQIAQSLCVR